MSGTIYLSWPSNGSTGWGWYGANLTRWASRAGWIVFSPGIDWTSLPPEWRLEGWDADTSDPGRVDVLITACGNRQVLPPPDYSKVDVAIAAIFFEDSDIPPAMAESLNRFDYTVCGSDWNRDLLTAAGVTNAVTILQGADQYAHVGTELKVDIFDYGAVASWVRDEATPHPRRIFSGGKLEYRKGQDIVVAAFREYLKTNPDAILVTAWQNRWPKTLKGIDAAGYVSGWPAMHKDGSLDIVGWCEKNGIPRANVIDVGMPPSWALQRVMAQCDVAVFPNRTEGGHNLVAAECLAVGLPTWATFTTGQAHLRDFGAAEIANPTPAAVAACMGDTPHVSTTCAAPPTWAEAVGQLLRLCNTSLVAT